jgi:hypothetical protein
VTVVQSVPNVDFYAPASTLVTDVEFTQVRACLVEGVADAAIALADGAPLVVGLPLLRRARYRPDALGQPDEPFSWKPAFVRRSLGIAAVQACADGRFRSPAEAVGPLADRAIDEWRRSGWRTFHWEPWFAGLGSGGRAAVLAAAVTWATPLWIAFDWPSVVTRAELGRSDDRWSVPGFVPVELRGRFEARVSLPGPSGAVPKAAVLVSVSSGRPGEGWRDELAFLALVAGLGSSGHQIPVRVVGLWPETGANRTVEVDTAALTGAVDRVVEAVAIVGDAAAASVEATAT